MARGRDPVAREIHTGARFTELLEIGCNRLYAIEHPVDATASVSGDHPPAGAQKPPIQLDGSGAALLTFPLDLGWRDPKALGYLVGIECSRIDSQRRVGFFTRRVVVGIHAAAALLILLQNLSAYSPAGVDSAEWPGREDTHNGACNAGALTMPTK
jgi:hypothetical protein